MPTPVRNRTERFFTSLRMTEGFGLELRRYVHAPAPRRRGDERAIGSYCRRSASFEAASDEVEGVDRARLRLDAKCFGWRVDDGVADIRRLQHDQLDISPPDAHR